MQDNSMDLPIDSFSGFAVQDSFSHTLVHDKRMFGFHTENLNTAVGAHHDVLIKTGALPIHLILSGDFEGGRFDIQVRRNAVATADGTPVDVWNYNDFAGAEHAPKASIFVAPTLSSIGTLWSPRSVMSGKNLSTAFRPGIERVLKPNSVYLIRHTSTANNSIAIVDGLFYEGNGLS